MSDSFIGVSGNALYLFMVMCQLDQRVIHQPADAGAAEQAGGIKGMIGEEKQANPFLRADIPEVAAGIGLKGKPAAEVFAEIRARKNKF